MKSLGEIVLHIPAREGSKRVPRKNIRNMAGNPMIFYAIKASLNSGVTNNIYVNTDSQQLIDYVRNAFNEVNIYKRKKSLADDMTTSDEFNMDIINALNPDTLIMINPVCPLIESDDIVNMVDAYKTSDCDTLISCSTTQMQTFCEGAPINICLDEQLVPSQKNAVVQILNWAVTIWDAKAFKNRYDRLGYSVLGENRLLYPIDYLKSFKVSEEKNFNLCESLILSKQ